MNFDPDNPSLLKTVVCRRYDDPEARPFLHLGKKLHCARCQCELIVAPRTVARLSEPNWCVVCHECSEAISVQLEKLGKEEIFGGSVPDKPKIN